MNRPARRLSLQLTPLLDLLLIVIFAQYLEVRESERGVAAQSAVLAEELQAARSESSQLRQMLDQASGLLDRMQQAMAQTSAQLADQQRVQERQQLDLEQSLARQRLLGHLMVELFQIPEPVIQSVLDPHREPPLAQSPQEVARLREQFRQMAESSPGEMVRHLLTFEEVRKRCDIWELHLRANPRRLVLKDRGVEHELPLRLASEAPSAPLDGAAFEQELYFLLKSLPQPKGLVIAVLTYDADSRNNVVEPAREAVQRVLNRLRADSAGRSQFEFADLGIPAL